MLSRNSSNASGRPRRSKSTPSIKPHQSAREQYAGFENEEIAHYQAVTAAELAYERAQGHHMATRCAEDGKIPGDAAQRPALARQKSIRFARPSAVPQRSYPITRRNAPDSNPQSKAQSLGLKSNRHNADADLSTARSLATQSPSGEGQFIEHNYASQPSSYRKLRKSKSMFTPGKKPSAVFPAGIPKAGRHFQRHSVRSSDSSGEPMRLPDPRLRKSISFLRGVAERLPTSNRQYARNDEAVQLARDQYVAQLEKQRLKEQPPFLNLISRRKPQKAFRRTVRTSSTNSYSSAITSPNVVEEPMQSTSIGVKARIFSQNLRKKLLKVFGRSMSEDSSIPAQHLDASRAHFGQGISPLDQSEYRYPPIPSPDAELLRRVGSRENFGHNSPVYVKEDGRTRSIRSVPSQGDMSIDKSRVTSWTDSTAANTINMPHVMGRKRLSVIKEDGGPHQPSSSIRAYNDAANTYAAFRQPYRIGSAGMVPEPQRIFSALQREIVKQKSQANLDDSDSGIDSGSDQMRSTRSSIALRRSANGSESYQGLFSPPHQHLDYSEVTEDLTPQQIATLNESGEASPKRPLHEIGSGFFHANKHIEQKKSSSPFRRALHDSIENDSSLKKHITGPADSSRTTPFQPMAAQYHFGHGTGSESIYSRTSGDQTPKAVKSSVSLMGCGIDEEPGTAIIQTTETARNRRERNQSRQHGDLSDRSSKSSGEWKKRLASDMAYFDDWSAENDKIYNALPVKESGHKRESAQFDEDDVEIGGLLHANQLPPQPLGLLRLNTNIPALRSETSRSMLRRFPFAEITPPNKPHAVRQTENTPPIRPSLNTQVSSRSKNDKEPLNARAISNSLGTKISQASLIQRNENANSPASSNSRHSPERAERLRRLKSKSSLSLHKAASSSSLGNTGGYLTESKIAHNVKASPNNPWLRGNASKENSPSPNNTPTHHSSDKRLVENFLKDRRRDMRISEEGSNDPAFL